MQKCTTSEFQKAILGACNLNLQPPRLPKIKIASQCKFIHCRWVFLITYPGRWKNSGGEQGIIILLQKNVSRGWLPQCWVCRISRKWPLFEHLDPLLWTTTDPASFGGGVEVGQGWRQGSSVLIINNFLLSLLFIWDTADSLCILAGPQSDSRDCHSSQNLHHEDNTRFNKICWFFIDSRA